MFSTTPLQRLRRSSYHAPIPDTLEVPAIGERPARSVPIEEATLDDVSFALVALEAENDARYRVAAALRAVVALARKNGAAGADPAIPAAAVQLEAGA
jgi:hypothetical protein